MRLFVYCRRAPCSLLLAALMLTGAGTLTAQAPSTSRPAAESPDTGVTFSSGAREVLLDMVVRDRRGRAVHDLTAEEVKVFEDGVEQPIVSFRLVEGAAIQAESASQPDSAAAPVQTSGSGESADPLRLNHLVSIVFHGLTADSRAFAYRAALDFVEKNLTERVHVGVFRIDTDLSTLEPFTNDHERLREALRSAASGGTISFSGESVSTANNPLTQVSFSTPAEAGAGASPGGNGGPTGPSGPVQADIFSDIMRRIESNSSVAMEFFDRVDRSNKVVFALRALVDGQKALSGRKTILLFSPGFQMPIDSKWRFDQLISEANRNNVSFYSIDSVGLRATTPSIYQTGYLTSGGLPPGVIPSRFGGALNPRAFRQFETQLESITASPVGNLQELAVETGGRLIANTNNFSKPLERVVEDFLTYYEVSYRPAPSKGDGSYRAVSVEVARAKADVQTRAGYFDMPADAGFDLAPHELPLLAALSSKPAPRDFAFRSRMLRFPGRSGDGAPRGALIVEFPLAQLSMSKAVSGENEFHEGRFSLLAQLKDAEGRIVKKSSQDVPLRVDAERVEAIRRGSFTLNRDWELAPGRYTLEVAVRDRGQESFGVVRSAALIQRAGDGPALSSVSLIRRVDAIPEAAPADAEEGGPFVCRLGKVVPTLVDRIEKSAATAVSHYFVIYPSAETDQPLKLHLQYERDGQVVGQATPELPEPEADGSIPYVATAPAASFEPGSYLMSVVVSQGDKAVRERTLFTVVD